MENTMQQYKGMKFGADSVEHAFAYIFGNQVGQRGTFHDADMFREGKLSELGEVIVRMADRIEARVATIRFSTQEQAPGGAKRLLDGAVFGLRNIGREMKKDKGKEPENYHWMLIGNLAKAIEGLLEHCEG
jgi:hypothetical protein